MEEWKTLIYDDNEIYEGYEVSNEGHVRSLNYRGIKGKIQQLKQSDNGKGYDYVSIRHNGKTKNILVHRATAFVWIPNDNPQEKTDVNHINENKKDNRVENLEWVTHGDNLKHGTCQERKGKSRGKRVKCVNTGQIFNSTRQAEKETGIHHTTISRICRGILKDCRGFVFEFVEEK